MSDTPPERSGATGSVSWQSFDRPEGTGETAAPGEQAGGEAASVHPAAFMALSQETQSGGPQSIEFLRDVEVELTAELGTARMQIKHILGLRPGSVVELNRLAGEPVDIMVNKTLIARGEVVVVDEKFAVRVVEIVPPERRLGSG
ncbi:flagellar motor switch protein FliN [Sphaerobacter thermophilus]|jgi:flagellar motor switch protein FliN/FliY|uniref:Flagellar motor switch protein FliN n=1 Tax=Sphaerobacter thermophilus (strain ATCC 49802 / DSM 20745 / KCCM 41009 / NCIMB 13125 / S 6022) TaxID=479434 RepID=D1C1A4_SPHTD|nr:flagellar motor switch protein FliN [Sphaerobacter thermophilus]ACZ38021.1 flagellar motor switch protein FliN [Sphaerobacter thermophilus DSM 20745]